MNCSARASSFTFPVATCARISPGSVVRAVSAQIGHWRSTNSVTVTGAPGSPSTPSCSGIPANIAFVGALPSAAGGVAGAGEEPPEDEMTIAATTAARATPATSARRRKRVERG